MAVCEKYLSQTALVDIYVTSATRVLQPDKPKDAATAKANTHFSLLLCIPILQFQF